MNAASRAMLVSASLLALTAFGCSGDDDDDGSAPGSGGSSSTVEPGGGGEPGAPEDEIPTFNGCPEADYVDGSTDDAKRTIAVASMGLNYAPRCLLVAAGQSVTWKGSMAAHPLAPGNPEDAAAGSADSPIEATDSGSSVTFEFPNAGTFPYYCELHAFGAGQGMAGVVHVR